MAAGFEFNMDKTVTVHAQYNLNKKGAIQIVPIVVDGTNTEKHLSIMLFPATTPKNILSQKYGSALVYHTEIQLGCAKDINIMYHYDNS